MQAVSILLLLAYASLVVELLIFPIPSEASTYQLFTSPPPAPASASDPLAAARHRSLAAKLVRYFLPTAIGVVMFLMPLAAVFAPALVDHMLPVAALRTPAVAWVGIAVVALGRGLTFTSVLQLRGARQREAHFLQPRGLFSISRNPGLLGMYLFYLGNCLIFPCVVLFAGFPVYVLNMHHRVRMEESHLRTIFGTTYRDYLRRVPRYLPH